MTFIIRVRQQMHRAFRLKRGEGFSLTEVLMASMLLGVILAATYGIWYGMQRTYGYTEEDMTAQQEARSAMNEMVELIRTAREPDTAVSDELDLVIVEAEPNSLVIWSDVDRDDNHDLELVRFRVDMDDRSLYRDTSETGDITFTTGVQSRLVGSWVSNDDEDGNELFSYVGMNGAELAMTDGAVDDPTKIREVHINLYVDVVMGKAPAHHELASVVQPRNLRAY